MQGTFHANLKDTMRTHGIIGNTVMMGAVGGDNPDYVSDENKDAVEKAKKNFFKQIDSWVNTIFKTNDVLTSSERLGNFIFSLFNIDRNANEKQLEAGDELALLKEGIDANTKIYLHHGYFINVEILQLISMRYELMALDNYNLLGFIKECGAPNSGSWKPTSATVIFDNEKNEHISELFTNYENGIVDHKQASFFIRSCLSSVSWKYVNFKDEVENYDEWKLALLAAVGAIRADVSGLRSKIDDYFKKNPTILSVGTVKSSKNSDDEKYARLVKGALVNVALSIVWTPKNELENSRIDDEQFTAVMWHYMQVSIDPRAQFFLHSHLIF